MALFEEEKWLNAVNVLQQKAGNFNQLFNRVLNSERTATVTPNLYNEYTGLVDRGRTIKNTISTTTSAIDTVYGFVTEALGKKQADSLSGLGFIPLIPIAIITGAIAAITYWINDAVKYLDKTAQVESLTRQGVTPEKAYTTVYGEKFNIQKYLPWIIGGTIGVLLLPRVLKIVRG